MRRLQVTKAYAMSQPMMDHRCDLRGAQRSLGMRCPMLGSGDIAFA
jgi:hypothetical protein